jgi:TP901 family phage tail tape measure protein
MASDRTRAAAQAPPNLLDPPERGRWGVSEIGDLYVVLRAVTEPFNRAVRTAAVEGETAGGRIGGAFGKLSKIGMVAGAAALTLAGVTIKMAGDFQAEMAKLNTQAGVSKDKIKDLSNGVLELAGQVGFSPTSLAESLFHVESNFESMGITSSKALELVKVSAEGAATGHADLVDVTNALTAAVASGIPGVQNMSQAMGVLNGIVGVGDMNMQDLASAFGSGMVATVKGFGLSITDVGAALAVFGDNNIRGSLAGTQLRMSVMALAKPVATAGDALKMLGMSDTQLAKDMQTGGLMKALEDLQDHMKKAGVGAKEQGAVITDVFGRKAGAGLNVLMDQMDRMRSKYPALNKAATGFGESWKSTQDTFNQQLHQTEQSLVAMGIKLGTVLLPYAQRFLKWLQEGIGWLTQHKGAVMVLAGALATTLVAAVLAVGGALIAAIGPAELIAAGIMALGGAAVYAYQHFATFRTIVDGIGRGLKFTYTAAVKGAQIATQGLISWFQGHGHQFSAAWDAVVKACQAAAKWFNTNVIVWVKARVAELVDWWHQHSSEIAAVWRAMWTSLQTAAKAWYDGFFRPLLTVLAAVWKLTWGLMRDGAKLAWAAISGITTTGIHFVLNVIGLVLDLLTGKWSRVWGDLKKLVGQALGDAVKTIKNVTSGFGTLLYDAGRNIISGLIKGIRSQLSGVKNAIGDVVSGVKSYLPWSPAKEGPLSGSGSPEIGGRNIGTQIAKGLAASVRDVRAASHRVAGAASLAVGGTGAGGLGALAVGGGPGGGGVVQTQVILQLDRRVLYRAMQTEALRYAKRNPTSGLALPTT